MLCDVADSFPYRSSLFVFLAVVDDDHLPKKARDLNIETDMMLKYLGEGCLLMDFGCIPYMMLPFTCRSVPVISALK